MIQSTTPTTTANRTQPGTTGSTAVTGTCFVVFAYDIGVAVELNVAERMLATLSGRKMLRHRRKTPPYFTYEPPPIRVTLDHAPFTIAGATSTANVEIVIFDFAAVSVTFHIPLATTLDGLLDLGEALYDNADLRAQSRQVAGQILEMINGAVTKPGLSDFEEDYVIYGINDTDAESPIAAQLSAAPETIAQILRAERISLSEQEIADAIGCRISFGTSDLVVVDWNAAIVVDEEFDDARTVLEYANVELLAQHLRARRVWPDQAVTSLRELAELRMDSAALFEGVNNALKLVGDQYLARLYRLAAQRLHLADWDNSILRKLEALESACDKVSMLASHRRAEVLEWIIILLIVVSIGLELASLAALHPG